MTVNKLEPKNTTPAPFAEQQAKFEDHKKDLLGHLRKEHGVGVKPKLGELHKRGDVPQPTPFDENQSWHRLTRVAQQYFRGQKNNPKPDSERKADLTVLENALKQARLLVESATRNEIANDLFIGWCAQANISAGSLALHANGRSELDRIDAQMVQAVAGLAGLEAAARAAVKNVSKKPGPRVGTGLLTMHDIIALAGLYQRSTGRKPTMRTGPFANFLETFLIAAGRADDTTEDYVVERLKEARKQARKQQIAVKGSIPN